MSAKTIKSFESKDGKRAVEFRQLPHGSYRFFELKWWPHDELEVRKALGEDGYWTGASSSGLYGTLEDCMKDAVGILPWFEMPTN